MEFSYSYPKDSAVENTGNAWSRFILNVGRLKRRTLKEEYGLERLKGKSPGSVKRELYSSLMAFTLVRAVMADTGTDVRTLSSCQARFLLATVSERMAEAGVRRVLELYELLLCGIAHAKLDQRPRLPHPRNTVMRKRHFIKLTISRAEWRKRVKKEAA